MESGEIVALVVVILILLAGTIFLCFRCCKTVLKMVKDEQTPSRNNLHSFANSFRDSIRRSFRSSFKNVSSGLRNSFRRRREGPNADRIRRKYDTKNSAVVSISTIQDMKARGETSEIHPAYLKKNLKNEGITADKVLNRGRGMNSKTEYPNPLYSLEEEFEQPVSNTKKNKSKNKGTKATLQEKLKSGISGYKKMKEEAASPIIKPRHKQNIETEESGGYTNPIYDGPEQSEQKAKPRYDTPFDESGAQVDKLDDTVQPVAPPSKQSNASVGRAAHLGEKYIEQNDEDLKFDNTDKKYMSVDSYI